MRETIERATRSRFPEVVSAKVPAGTNADLERIAAEENCEKSDVTRQALADFIGMYETRNKGA